MITLKSLRIKRNVLLGYWILVPILFYFYLFLVSFNQQVPISQLIAQIPGLALTLLLSFLTLFQAAFLYFIDSKGDKHSLLVKKYLSFGMIQQVMTGNILGAALCFFYNKQVFAVNEVTTKNEKIIFYSVTVFIGLISLVILLITIRMRGI